MKIASAIQRLLRVREASAHCDIPCGIYDPVSTKIAAQTVQKMVLRIQSWSRPTTRLTPTRCRGT